MIKPAQLDRGLADDSGPPTGSRERRQISQLRKGSNPYKPSKSRLQITITVTGLMNFIIDYIPLFLSLSMFYTHYIGSFEVLEDL